MNEQTGPEFEAEVLRIARALWPADEYAGPIIIDGRERDGVFILDDCINIVECTILREKKKALQDCDKINLLARSLRILNPYKPIRGWFVTLHEPTAEQRMEADKTNGQVIALSFSQFQSKLIDARGYLAARMSHFFGSAEDIISSDTKTPVKYIEVDILEPQTGLYWSIDNISEAITSGERFTILGDYGIGKSMALKEIFSRLRKMYIKGQSAKFPIYINLRDHHGQDDPAEILHRHCKRIGFQHPDHLVRAWKSGFTILILDGFDEIASSALQGAWKRMAQARHQSMKGIRQFIRECPSESGVAIAGRNSFFSTTTERQSAIGDADFHLLQVQEFTEVAIVKFLSELGFTAKIPSWLPSRPLLLATIFSRALDVSNGKSGSKGAILGENPAEGWTILMQTIAEREAKMEVGVTANDISEIYRRLATYARGTTSGLGPLPPHLITTVYEQVTGLTPSEEALLVLQRLPGLGVFLGTDDGSRTFIDEDIQDAFSAADQINLIENPYEPANWSKFKESKRTLGKIGRAIVLNWATAKNYSDKSHQALIHEYDRHSYEGSGISDIILLGLEMGLLPNLRLTLGDIHIDEIVIKHNNPNGEKIAFTQCVINVVEISENTLPASIPLFSGCLIQRLDDGIGCTSGSSNKFPDCVIEESSDETDSNSAVLKGDLPISIRLLVVCLRKLYYQSLGGRQRSAFERGIRPEHRIHIPGIINSLISENLAVKYSRAGSDVILPVKRQLARVRKIVSGPVESGDTVVKEVLKL